MIGPIPLTSDDAKDGAVKDGKDAPAPAPAVSRGPRVLPDGASRVVEKKTSSTHVSCAGTYATQSALTEAAPTPGAAPQRRQTLRTLLLEGDAFTGCVLAGTLTKLVRRTLLCVCLLLFTSPLLFAHRCSACARSPSGTSAL